MRFFKSEGFGLVLSNTASQFVIRFITSLTTFTVTLLITYFFGIHVFGSFTKITTFVSFFYLLVNFGMNAIYIKDYQQKLDKLLLNVIALRLVIALALYLIIASIIRVLPYNSQLDTGSSTFEKIGAMIFALTLFSQALVVSINILFQRYLIYHRAIIPNLLSSFVISISLGISTLYKNIWIVLLSYSASGLVFFISSYSFLKKRIKLIFNKDKFIPFSKNLLLSSFPLALLYSFNLIYFRADTFILSLYRSSFDVGVYGFAYKIFEFIIALPTFFSNSIYPILVEKEKNQDVFFSQVRNYSFLLLFISFLIMMLTILFSPLLQIIRADLIYSVAPLRILSLSLPFFFLTSLLQWVLVIKNKKFTLAAIYFISMIINILLDLVFIPRFSYISAAYITVVSEIFVFILIITVVLFLIRKRRMAKSEN